MNTVRAFFCFESCNPEQFLVNPKNGKPAGMISTETYEVVQKNAQVLDSAIIYDRDFNYNL